MAADMAMTLGSGTLGSGMLSSGMLASGGGPLDAIAAQVFLAVAVIVVVARAVGLVFRRFGQPMVLGEIVAGIALGPSLLGLLPGDLPTRLFPLDARPYLKVAAELGLVVFMFVVGLEIDPASVRRSGRRAVVLSLSSIAAPMLLGSLVLAHLLYADYGSVGGEQVRYLPFALFMGVAMSGTAFAVLARILTERNMFRLPIGMLAIACAAIDDIVVFALLTVVVSIASSASLTDLPVTLGELVLFVLVLFAVVRPLLDRFLISRYRAAGKLGADVLGLLLAGALVSAYVAHLIGLASLIGAFLFGAAVPRRDIGSLAHEVAEKVEGISVVVLLPVFFVVTGLNVDVRGLGLDGVLPLLAVMATACVGKFVGGGVSARLMGVSNRQSLALATLMNTRGLTELVILNVGRSAGLIDGPLFTMMVIMAITTTVMAGPLLSVFYPERLLQRDIAEADRRRAGDGARYRVSIVVPAGAGAGAGAGGGGGGGGGQPSLAALADVALRAIGPQRPAEVSLLALLEGNDMASLTGVMAATQPVRAGLERAGVRVVSTVRFAGDPLADTLAELGSLAPDCIVVGWSADPAAVAALQAIAAADLADVVLVAGPWQEVIEVAEAPAAGAVVVAHLHGAEAMAVAEQAARRLAIGGATLIAEAEGRSGRAATEQLEKAGFAARAARPSEHGPRAAAVHIAPLQLVDGALDVATVASAASSAGPLLLVKGRQGERAPLHEQVAPAVPGADGELSPGAAGPGPAARS